MIEQRADACEYLLFDQLAALPQVAHAVFTRRGGFSAPPFDGLNLSRSSGDDPAIVARNQGVVAETLGMPLVSARPVHGADIVVIEAEMLEGAAPEDVNAMRRLRERLRATPADAMITRVPGIALFWAYGDCAPIILVDTRQNIVALVHAGWRGAAAAVAQRTVMALRERFGSRPEDLLASVGPAIGACCYEVPHTVRAAFAAHPLAADTACIVERADPTTDGPPRIYLDVGQTAARQLLAAGVPRRHIEVSGYCTGCEPDLFYSNRRGPRHRGRFGVAVGLRPQTARVKVWDVQ